MEAVFDTLFGNILVLLAIVGGIASFIKDRKKKKVESNDRHITPKPTKTPSGGYQMASEERSQTTSAENQQDNRIEEQQGTHRSIVKGKHDAIAESTLRKPSDGSNKKNEMKRQIKQSLSKRGLVSGIIMNEVLGRPRAAKPYKSVTAERRK